MARQISAEGLRELFAQHSGHAMLALLVVTHDTLPEPIRLVNDRKPLSFDGHDYIALPFELTLPADTEEEMPSAQLTLDNVGRELTALLRSVNDPPQIDLSIVRVAPDGAVALEMGPMEFSLLDTKMNAATITCRLGYEVDVLNMPATQEIFNPSLAPGLFS